MRKILTYRMKPRSAVLAAVAVVIISAEPSALAGDQNATNAESRTETKVSESHKQGKYVRTTEVFQDKALVSRTREVSSQDNGKIDEVYTKLFRDGEMIYLSGYRKADNATIRSYWHSGKLVAQEGDEDGDGFFETMILFDAQERPIEAFTKHKDGTVVPFSKEKLSKLQKSFARFED